MTLCNTKAFTKATNNLVSNVATGSKSCPQTLNEYSCWTKNTVALLDRNGAFPERTQTTDSIDDYAGEALNVSYQDAIVVLNFIEPASEFIDLTIKAGKVIGNIPYRRVSIAATAASFAWSTRQIKQSRRG